MSGFLASVSAVEESWTDMSPVPVRADRALSVENLFAIFGISVTRTGQLTER